MLNLNEELRRVTRRWFPMWIIGLGAASFFIYYMRSETESEASLQTLHGGVKWGWIVFVAGPH